MPTIKTFDFYRKIPLDLTETTLQGAVMSGCALFCMLILFLCELRAFLTPEVYTTVAIDSNQDSKLRINFNITMLSLPCDYASVDVLDLLGTNKVNMTQNIVKWHTDENGVKREFHGRNKAQEMVKHDEHHRDLDLAHEDGEHAVPLTSSNFKDFIEGNDNVMVDFFAPWCVWCIKLAPTWEAFAEEVERDTSLSGKLRVAKVDCVEERELCSTQSLMAFPTIRYFKGGVQDGTDYSKDRSVTALMQYAQAKVGGDEKTLRRYGRLKQDYPGCQLSGFIMVNRVPGNFHIEARSALHSIDPTAANVSHVVKTLKFGTEVPVRSRRAIERGVELEGLPALEDRVYSIDSLHTAPHHYIKVVSTFVGDLAKADNLQYQMMVSSQIMPYEQDQVPEAKFSYDLSPMSVYIKQRRRKWYDFLTSVLAIVGGTFTVVGVLDNILFRVVKQKKI
ncbi:unnamed protein product [Ectocarpus sp. CCAP 1310/34]|nr:unnamed protein product [Ectocarpus sp. CCAP 1310/34]